MSDFGDNDDETDDYGERDDALDNGDFISADLAAYLADLWGITDLSDLPTHDVNSIEHPEELRGIHFASLEEAVIYVANSPAMIPWTMFVEFGPDDWGIEVGDSN